MEKAVVLRNAGQSAYVIITQLTTFVAIGPKELKQYKTTGSTTRRKGSGRSKIISDNERQVIEQTMQKDDETTIAELTDFLKKDGHVFSKSTVLRCRKELGWTSRGSAYCQLIRENNKKKRLAWAHKHSREAKKGFKNVVFTDN